MALGRQLPRERLLHEAALLFSERGVGSASMRMLAERLGVTKAALYHYFPSKAALHFEIHRKALDDALDRLRALHRADIPAPAKVESVTALILGALAENRPEYTVLLHEASRLELEHTLTLKEKTDEYRGLVEEILVEGERAGDFALPDPGTAALALLGMCNWAHTWYRSDGPLTVSEIARRFSRIFLSGITAPPSRSSERSDREENQPGRADVVPSSVVPSGPPWRLGVSKPPSR